MKKIRLILSVITIWTFLVTAAFASSAPSLDADQALNKLIDGNKRYVAEQYSTPSVGMERRAELSKGQHPFAIIVGCSDSRIAPEIAFDQGLGDLFVIRTAGEVIDDVAVGSIEYAVEHLGVQLIVVLGHEECGAVKATVAGGDAHGHVASIVEGIKPAFAIASKQEGSLVDNTINANVDMIVSNLKASDPVLKNLVNNGKLKIVGAVYDLNDGSIVLR